MYTFIGRPLVDYQLTIDRLLVDSRLIVDWYIDRLSADSSADICAYIGPKQSKVNEIFVISLGPNREERLHSTQMFELSRLYGEIWPANWPIIVHILTERYYNMHGTVMLMCYYLQEGNKVFWNKVILRVFSTQKSHKSWCIIMAIRC